MLKRMTIDGYRSLRNFRLTLSPTVTVLMGPNGAGKTNVYSAMRLLQSAALGRLAPHVAGEGGMAEILWAGEWKTRERARVALTAEFDDYHYHLALGPNEVLPDGEYTLDSLAHMFPHDSQIKEERVTLGARGATVMCQRDHDALSLRDQSGSLAVHPGGLDDAESVLAQIREPGVYPELVMLGQTIAGWRFCHDFRTDDDAPARRRQVGVRTPVLSEDAHDLVSALMTIHALGDAEALVSTLDRVVPNWQFMRDDEARVWLSYVPDPHELCRRFSLRNASDGMIRFLCLAALLLSPRPPHLLVLNEPENSLHPDLYEPLSRLIAIAGRHGQILVTTHARPFAELLERDTGQAPQTLSLKRGVTRLDDAPFADL